MFWARFTEKTDSYIHCIEYDYCTSEGGGAGEDWAGMVSKIKATTRKQINDAKDDLVKKTNSF